MFSKLVGGAPWEVRPCGSRAAFHVPYGRWLAVERGLGEADIPLLATRTLRSGDRAAFVMVEVPRDDKDAVQRLLDFLSLGVDP